MPIPFTCSHCGAQTQIDEKYAGQSGPCFRCGKTVSVPSHLGSQTPAFSSPETSASMQATSQRSSKLLWVMIAGVSVIALCCVISVPVALILPAINAAREQARRAMCTNNLRQIGVALQNYHDTQGCFPPPYFADAAGKPIHSWRVLLLPYMGETELYDRYKFDEPWDGAHNRELEKEMPAVYRCPSGDPALGLFDTNYVAVVGPGLLFDPKKRIATTDVADGLENTIAVVESSGPTGAKISWMSPDDPAHGALNRKVNGTPGPAISSDHPGGANVLLADGQVQFLNEAIDEQVLQDYLTIDGHENHVPLDDMDADADADTVPENADRSPEDAASAPQDSDASSDDPAAP